MIYIVLYLFILIYFEHIIIHFNFISIYIQYDDNNY